MAFILTTCHLNIDQPVLTRTDPEVKIVNTKSPNLPVIKDVKENKELSTALRRRRDRYERQAHHITQQQELLNISSNVYNGLFTNGNYESPTRSVTSNGISSRINSIQSKNSPCNGNYSNNGSLSSCNNYSNLNGNANSTNSSFNDNSFTITSSPEIRRVSNGFSNTNGHNPINSEIHANSNGIVNNTNYRKLNGLYNEIKEEENSRISKNLNVPDILVNGLCFFFRSLTFKSNA